MGSLFRRCESGAALRSVGGRGVEKIRKKTDANLWNLVRSGDERAVSGETQDNMERTVSPHGGKRDRYVKMGFEYTAAENKVYEDMGDPKEVAKLLRTVHQLWLDWSLCLTRCLIILLVVWIFKSSGFSLIFSPSNLDEKIWRASPVLMPDDEYGIFSSRKATWTDNELRIGPSRISIDSVTLWRAWFMTKATDSIITALVKMRLSCAVLLRLGIKRTLNACI